MRFPGFSVEWERVKVSDLLDFFSTNSLSWDMLNYENGKILNLHYGLIHKDLPTIVNMKDANLPFINNDKIPKNYTICENGDVAFADASEDTNDVGKAIEFINIDRDIVCGLHTIHGRDKTDITVDGFKGYLFSSKAYHNQIRRIAQGTKIYSISSKNMDEIYLGIPSKREQEKIFALLYAIDRRIATQNKIIEKLQSLIKGLRTFIFSGLFESYAKLGEIAKLYQPQTISTSELQSEGYIVYGANGIIGHYHSYNHARPQICITCRGNTCGQVSLTSPFSWITGNAMVVNIENKVEINQIYLFHFLKNYNFNSIITGSGQPQIVRTPLERIKVPITNLTEQKRIANTLDTNNKNLIIECNLKELYVRQKQFLLQKLFI
ncbi:restriction endonuclease subunit S [Muribaculaceae bacterium Isolate-037 (Harlan)]|nr:restriction endonuclease subunit S [Muribaculaceae bacterium Isolate-037 (Harlan)]